MIQTKEVALTVNGLANNHTNKHIKEEKLKKQKKEDLLQVVVHQEVLLVESLPKLVLKEHLVLVAHEVLPIRGAHLPGEVLLLVKAQNQAGDLLEEEVPLEVNHDRISCDVNK